MNKLLVAIMMSLVLVIPLSTMAGGQNWWEQRDYEDPLDDRQLNDAWNSRVKWDDGYIEVMAGATADPKKAQNLAHARSLALKTARHLSYEKMLETIKGLNIDSQNVFRDELVANTMLRTSVSGVIKGARVVKEEEKTLQDGSIWMEVTMGLFLNHMKGLSAATVPWYWDKVGSNPNQFHPKDDKYKSSAMYGEKYTGLIIDASNLEARPSMFPKILTATEKKEIYGPSHVGRDYAINQGVAGYAGSVEKALLHKRAGSHPLTVKAVGTDGVNKSNFLVSEEDATRIFAADIRQKFLDECRVVIVIN